MLLAVMKKVAEQKRRQVTHRSWLPFLNIKNASQICRKEEAR
jgi:hypothetical protein